MKAILLGKKALKENNFNNWSVKEIVSFLKTCDEAYYNDGITLTPKVKEIYQQIPDKLYDKGIDALQEINSNHKYLKKVGAPVPQKRNTGHASKRMTKLPFNMASLDKLKPENVDKWLNKLDYVIVSNKLDGMSGGLINDGNGNLQLFTRGNGITGQDISDLVDVIPALRKQKKIKKAYQIRGELIIPRSAFKQYENKFSNARNMMGGMLNNSIISPAFKYAKFIAYTVIKPKLPPFKAFKLLDSLGFETPDWTIIENPTSNKLSKLLEKRKQEIDFDIDGLVISQDVYEPPKIDNPKYSKAYKDNSFVDKVVARVTGVEWQISKYGALKPVVHVVDNKTGNPCKLSGANVSRATGFNAKYILDNKIGKGTLVYLIRSGSVIPKIDSVIKGTKAELPDIDYSWNKTGVDIYIQQENDVVNIKRITNFFTSLGLESIKEKIFEKMYNAGYNTINKIIDITKSELLELPGIQKTMADKIYTGIQECISNVNLVNLMYGSSCFKGEIGTRRFAIILKHYPDVLNWDCTKQDVAKIAKLEKFSNILANSFIKGLKDFKVFLKKLNKKVQYTLPSRQINGTLTGQVVVMTGFRDKDISKFIIDNGGEEGNSITHNTTLLLVKDKNSTSGKMTKAKSLGIKIMTRDEFVNTYM